MAEKSTPKGRGALLEILKKHKEEKALGLQSTTVAELPPKCRGRAALLQRLQEMKEKRLGGGEPQQLLPSPGPSGAEKRETIEKLAKSVSELSVTSSEPSYYRGQSGTPIKVITNYIRMEIEKDTGVFEYEVRFQPDVDSKSNRIKLVNGVLGELRFIKVYDGDSCLYLPKQHIKEKEEMATVIPNTTEKVTIILIYKRKKKPSDPQCIHLYNVLLKKVMNDLLYTRIGRNYFDTEHKYMIPQHKLEVYPGYAFAVDEVEGGLMFYLDTQHRVVRSQTVHELLLEIRATNPRNFKETAMKSIIGSCILTKYNNKNYIIDDIAWNMNPTETFEARDGSACTFLNYYKSHYNITIQDREQPLLISKRTVNVNGKQVENMVCLVPELSYLTGLTDAMRSDLKVMKDVAAYTRVTPNQRMLALRKYLENVRNSESAQQILSGWGLTIAGGTTDINARVLPQEAIYFGGPHSEERKFISSDWNRALSENKVTGPVDLLQWQLYYTHRDQNYATNFAKTLLRLSTGMGCVIREPQQIVLADDRTETYMSSIQENLTKQVQMAVFICPTIRADRYSIIKKMCYAQFAVPSQVILSKTLSNPQKNRTITHKIGMQMNCKLGGTLWSVKIPVTNWMVVGIDVYHGANNQSVCGFVCSTNDSLTRWYSEALFQEREIGDFFKMAFRKALLENKQKRGSFPVRIVIIRDGVGDGQLEHCRRYEVSQFKEVLKELNIEAGITFTVIQKRINTRLFKKVSDNASSCDNPPAGTVVDTTVTRRNLKDFFLVPQSVKQGTVNPTHYIILHDDSDMKPDHIERLAYKLCHLYYNWSGTIRVPAPCLYAHKLAALVGQYIKKTPCAELNDKLYYL